MTGLLAAVAAARRGLRVRLVGEGTGLIHLSSGCIDILGVDPGQGSSLIGNPLEGVTTLVRHRPDHPYALIGRESLEESIAFFQDVMHLCGLQYMGTPTQNRFFITAAGTIKHSCLYPYSFNTPPSEEIGTIRFVAVRGIRGFFPAMAAALSTRVFPGKKVDFVEIDLFERKDTRMTPLAMSIRFQDLDFREHFFETVAPLCERSMAVGIPALFSPLAAREIIQRFRKVKGAYLFEMATIPPSLPGYHLGQSLLEYAVALGVEPYIGGRVTSFTGSDGHISSVTITRPGRDITLTGKNFLLATGSLLGGGLAIRNNTIVEPLFGLPITMSERAAWFGDSFFGSSHPIRRAGVTVDGSLRPIDPHGNVIYENLWAAGTILAGADIIAERSGGGICLGSALKSVRSIGEVNP